jgi:hypothetical protein
MQLGNVLALDGANWSSPKAWHNIELSDTLVLASSTRLSLRLYMLCHELVEHHGQRFVSL